MIPGGSSPCRPRENDPINQSAPATPASCALVPFPSLATFSSSASSFARLASWLRSSVLQVVGSLVDRVNGAASAPSNPSPLSSPPPPSLSPTAQQRVLRPRNLNRRAAKWHSTATDSPRRPLAAHNSLAHRSRPPRRARRFSRLAAVVSASRSSSLLHPLSLLVLAAPLPPSTPMRLVPVLPLLLSGIRSRQLPPPYRP